jgi:DNA-binding GntR family transcriptional regulator
MSKHQYQRVYQELKSLIEAGQYQEGDMLPSENELSNQYGITRVTVRQALGELVRDGFINRIQGKGSVVQSNSRPSLGLLSFKGFSEVVQKSHHEVKTIFLKTPAVTTFPDKFFYNLTEEELDKGCLYIERVRFADEDPVLLEYTYVPVWGLKNFIDEPLIENSLFKTLNQRYNIDIKGLEQEIRAVGAEAGTAFLLKTPTNAPIIQMYRRYSTNKRGFYVYSSLFCNTEKYAMGSTW